MTGKFVAPLKSPPQSPRRAAGFTLVEVLVALTLLAVSAGLLLAVQGVDRRLTKAALDKELAHWLARSRLAEAVAYPEQTPPDDGSEEIYEGIPFATRTEYREVAAVATEGRPPKSYLLTEIRVIVSWGDKVEQKVQLSAYRPWFTPGGVDDPAAESESDKTSVSDSGTGGLPK